MERLRLWTSVKGFADLAGMRAGAYVFDGVLAGPPGLVGLGEAPFTAVSAILLETPSLSLLGIRLQAPGTRPEGVEGSKGASGVVLAVLP